MPLLPEDLRLIPPSLTERYNHLLPGVVVALIRSRRLLGYELAHAKGLIEEKEFQALFERLRPRRPDVDLEGRIYCLALLSPEGIDAELISSMYGCDPQEAEEILGRIARQLANSQTTGGNDETRS